MPNGSVATANPPAAATIWPTCASSPIVRSVHSTGVPSAAGLNGPPARGQVRARTLRAAGRRPGRRAHAAQPGPGMSVRGVSPAGPVIVGLRGRRPRARCAASPRSARARSGRPGSSTPITSRAAVSRRCASRPVRSSSPGSTFEVGGLEEALDRPVGDGLQRRDVGAQTMREPLQQVRARAARAAAPPPAGAAQPRARRPARAACAPPRGRRARACGEQPAGRVAAARLDHPRRRRRDRLDVSRGHRAARDAHRGASGEVETQFEAGRCEVLHRPMI